MLALTQLLKNVMKDADYYTGSAENTIHLLPNARGGLQLCGGQQRSSLCQPPGTEVQTHLPIESWHWSHQGKYKAVKSWMEQCFHPHREQTARSTPRVCMGQSLMAGGSPPPANAGQLTHTHSSVLQHKDPNPSLMESEIPKGEGMPEGH